MTKKKFNRDMESKSILLHELNHQYGAPDHYHDVDPITRECRNKDICSFCNPNTRPTTCIMNDSSQDINSDTIICDYCKADILAHLALHH